MRFKHIARNTLFPFAITTGIEKIFLKFSKGNILNVFYHGVVEKDSTDIFPRHITKDKFEAHLEYYKKNFDVIWISEALEMRKKGIKPKRKTITISFDDGYENNLTQALPLLEKYQLKCSCFISGFCVEDPDALLWADSLAMAKSLERDKYFIIDGFPFVKRQDYTVWNEHLNMTGEQFIKCMPPATRDRALNDLHKRYFLDQTKHLFPREIWKLLHADQIRELAASPLVEIGSHGQKHFCLGIISPVDAQKELKQSKSLLENTIGKPVNLLAFPDGSYTEAIKNIARQEGYTGLIAVNKRYESDFNESDILERHGVSSTTTVSSNLFFLNYSFTKLAF